ncbi:hypothetical protein NBRC116188_29180 [Oceaniserpentilla sp. 4NH20-0058]|uniref:DUF1439 domain-containing protein n=1 Tax=Oceaniserpentilla sp. 4NH20-0058 TaxID=3127660 RepID=UPI0031069502
MKIKNSVLKIWLLVLICSVPSFALGFTQTLVFTEEELQTQLNQVTPLQKQTLFANIVMTDANINLLESANQLEVTAFLDVTALGGMHGTGNVTIRGSLVYKSEKGAFYLSRPRITQLHIDKINPDVVEQIQPLVQDLLAQSLQRQPIYQLDDQDMRQSLIKTTLKNVEISNNQVHVYLGF